MVLPFPDITSSTQVGPSPTSMLSASEIFSSFAATPRDDDCMEHDRTEAFFPELADLEAPVVSTNSSKKRKLEEGEEFSSPFIP